MTSLQYFQTHFPSKPYHTSPNKQKLSIKVNNVSTVLLSTVIGNASGRKVLRTTRHIASVSTTTKVGYVEEILPTIRRNINIPTKKQLIDPVRQGVITQGGVGYKQTVVIRSYEVGADKTATLESILNLLQVIKTRETLRFPLMNYCIA